MPQPLLTASMRTSFLQMIEERAGLRLSANQAAALDTTVAHMLTEHQYASPMELLQAMTGDPRSVLIEALAAKLTVGETHFFRVAPQIEALRQIVLPDLLTRHAVDRRLAVWSAGCSTGEEPYTLAMLIREQLPATDPWNIRLLATDLSHKALDHAREARYGARAFRGTPEVMRQRFFVREQTGWRLIDAIRRMVSFAHMNIASDSLPESLAGKERFDLIVCRNVTIYFNPDATQRLYQRFAEWLAPEGWLMLGPSDPPPAQTVPLQATYLPGAILWRLPAPVSPPPVEQGPGVLAPLPARGRQRPAAAKTSQKLAEGQVRAQSLSAETHLRLGMIALDQGGTERAIESLRRATFLDPDHALAQFSLGRAYIQAGDLGRARAALNYARRVLAPLPDRETVAGGDDLLIGDLRHAIDVQLAALAGTNRV